MRLFLAALLISACASPALAQVRIVPDAPADAVSAVAGVDVFIVNEGDQPESVALPSRIEVVAKNQHKLTLYRVGDSAVDVAAGGFVKGRYRNVDPVAIAEARRIEVYPARAAAQASATASEPPVPDPAPANPARGETLVQSSVGTPGGFLDRFEPYEPIYGAFGGGDAGAKLQLSLAFRPFKGAGVLDGLRAAWTQTLFWDIQDSSGPIRQTDYSPEVYYQLPIGDQVTAAFGYRHTSNGRGPVGSIDANRIYARAAIDFDLGGDWSANIVPQAWLYVGTQGIAPDLENYWGYGSLTTSIIQRDGVKLQGMIRGNPGTGRGAAELFASYPLTRLGGGLGLYLFAQGFTGYGESLSEYNLRSSHARLGIAFTR